MNRRSFIREQDINYQGTGDQLSGNRISIIRNRSITREPLQGIISNSLEDV
jgi:hypothetical protein